MNRLHVVPINDLTAHDTTSDDCVCGPRQEFVENAVGGPDGWLIVHNSLDGRERYEVRADGD
jgi:hypothetical protein